MLSKLNHELIDMMVLLHLEGLESVFGGLSHVQFAKQLVKFDDEFTPVTSDQRFWECHKVGLPPEQSDFRQERGSIGDLLTIVFELEGLVVEVHNAQGNK